MAEENSNDNSKTIMILLVLSLIGNGVLGFLYFNSSQEVINITASKEEVSLQRDQVIDDLEDLQEQFEFMETSNEELSAELETQRLKIDSLLQDAKKHKDDAYIIFKLRKQVKELQEISKGYLVKIDSLNTANIELTEEKKQVLRQLSKEKKRYNNLETEKQGLADKVAIGAKLNTLNLRSEAQRVKSNSVHRPTNRANKAEKVKTCFTIDKNEVTEPGKKLVYIRIISPDGKVLALEDKKENMLTINGVQGLYSRKTEVDYQNEPLDLCLFWDVKEPLVIGKYRVFVYAEGNEIGQTELELK